MRPLAVACGTLTTWHIPIEGDVTRTDLVASTGWYPVVGAAIGVLVGLPLLLPISPLVRASLSLIVWVVLTGALHLDGWADCADAALAPDRGNHPNVREWRLGILKDPHVGSFGVIGLVLMMLMKVAALTVVSPLAPIVAASVARYGIVLVIAHFDPARPNGLVAGFDGATAWPVATRMVAVVVAVIAWIGPLAPTLFALGLGLCAGILLAKWLSLRFGGVTGDVCGAAAEIAELVALLAFVPMTS